MRELMGGKGWLWLVLATSAPQLPSSAFYQPALNRATTSKIKNLKGFPLYSFILERWGDIFQVLESESHHTIMLSSRDIKIAKGEGVKTEKRVLPLLRNPPKICLSTKNGTQWSGFTSGISVVSKKRGSCRRIINSSWGMYWTSRRLLGEEEEIKDANIR